MKTYGRITNMEAVLILGVRKLLTMLRGAASLEATAGPPVWTAAFRGVRAVTIVGAQSWKSSKL